MTDRSNMLLITVDSLRADHVYGDAAETPSIEGMADEGVVAEQAFAQGPFTTFSMPSLFTSRYPSHLTSIDFVEGVEGVLVEGAPTIQERLQTVGYTTAGIHTNPLLSSLFGFDVGFDHFEDGLGRLSNRLPSRLTLLADKLGRLLRRHPYVPAETLTDRAVDWLQTNDTRPFFLWVHYMDPHGPYQSRDGFQYLQKYRAEALWRKAVHSPEEVTDTERERLREAYVEEVEYTDQAIGRLLQAFNEATDNAESMTILTADHGDEFYEHGSFSHENKLYDELIQVPLIVRPPAYSSVPEERVGELVPLLDVGPTIIDVAGADDRGFEGRSLFVKTILKNKDESLPENPVISEAKLDPEYVGAVRTDRWKFIDDAGDLELYDLSADPGESNNVVRDESEVASTLGELLDTHRDQIVGDRREAEVLTSGELDDQLRSLGYIE